MQPSLSRRYLFVSGAPRSGTTILAHLLNSHPDIAIGIERYKFLLMRDEQAAKVSAALFDPERFFARSEEDTNILLKVLGDKRKFRAKLERATYVGDKVPRLILRTRELDQWFPGNRMIFIFRDPYRVAASWTARAEKSDDNWDASRDYKASVETMNKFFDIAIRLRRKNPDRFMVVQYERIFDPADSGPIRTVVDWLGLEFDPAMQAKWEGNAGSFVAVADKAPADIDVTFIKKEVDWTSYKRLTELAA